MGNYAKAREALKTRTAASLKKAMTTDPRLEQYQKYYDDCMRKVVVYEQAGRVIDATYYRREAQNVQSRMNEIRRQEE